MHAATDVTGFGLLGHLHEMVEASGCAAALELAAVPVFDAALDYAAQGVVPGRTADVIAWADEFSAWESPADRELWMKVLCDPQTSGGLLIASRPSEPTRWPRELEARSVLHASHRDLHRRRPRTRRRRLIARCRSVIGAIISLEALNQGLLIERTAP